VTVVHNHELFDAPKTRDKMRMGLHPVLLDAGVNPTQNSSKTQYSTALGNASESASL
jgi:hypothetical protein